MITLIEVSNIEMMITEFKKIEQWKLITIT